MPIGISLHIGVNRVDQSHYLGLEELKAAVNDAKDYQTIAKEIFGYQKTGLLLDEQASTHNVKSHLLAAADQLSPGDIFFLSYSGHGGLVEDPHFRIKGDEPYDQTWCLYDRQLLDDELYEAFKKFKPGVRILVISDSCHSGSVTREVTARSTSAEASLAQQENEFTTKLADFLRESDLRSKEVPTDLARRINSRQADLYSTLQDKYKKNSKTEDIGASVRLFAACQDNQITFDGKDNGRFTSVIKDIIYSGEWQELTSTQQFIERLRKAYAFPTPNFYSYGADNLDFDYNFPLMIDLTPADPIQMEPIPGNPTAKTPETPPHLTMPIQTDQEYEAISMEFPSGWLLQELALKLVPPQIQMIKTGNRSQQCFAMFRPSAEVNLWDTIHQIAGNADRFGVRLKVSPAFEKNFPVEEDSEAARAAGAGFEYMPMWPPVSNFADLPLGWHLGDDYSQLGEARNEIWKAINNGELENSVKIAHIDTGWWPFHPALKENPNIDRKFARSFINGEEYENADAVDYDVANPMEQQMHGIGTLGIIAGWQLDKSLTFGEELGYIGAAPFIPIVPIRVTESVIILNPDSIAEAVDYAVKIGCQVITMSLGGNPNKKLARAVNRAYEAGVTFVSAAGNSIIKGAAAIGPRTLVYPARYDRVLAACGVAQNDLPYDFDAQLELSESLSAKGMTDYMQGNWGPEDTMNHAIAAYTPNIPWLSIDTEHPVKKNGGGTSSATPQVATTVALWLLKHQKELKAKGYQGTWKQVEAVRQALYKSAKPGPFEDWQKYYGRGIIQAKAALSVPVPEEKQLKMAPEARSSWAGLMEMAGLLILRSRSKDQADATQNNLQDSLELEMQYHLNATEEGQALLKKMEHEATELTAKQVERYLKEQPGCSAELLGYLGA